MTNKVIETFFKRRGYVEKSLDYWEKGFVSVTVLEDSFNIIHNIGVPGVGITIFKIQGELTVYLDYMETINTK